MAIDVRHPHALTIDEARARVQDLADALSHQLSLRTRWEGDRLVFKRLGAKGYIDVDESEVLAHVETKKLLPVSDSWLREQITAQMRAHLA